MARLLLIDDDPLFSDALIQILERAGHQVTHAENGAVGLAAFEAGDFDLVITDIVMPEREGIETIQSLSTLDPDLPIIAISGGGPSMRAQDCLRLADGFGTCRTFRKPFDTRKFLDAIDDILGLVVVRP